MKRNLPLYKVMQEPVTPFEFVSVDGLGMTSCILNPSFRVMVNTIHDGEMIPSKYWELLNQSIWLRKKGIERFNTYFVSERDWGADLVAKHLAKELHNHTECCRGFYRVKVARVLMDYGRFPGNTPKGAEHLHRFAINYPFSNVLDYDLKKGLLENYYDRISDEFECILPDNQLNIAIHTYDKYNTAGTERPLMSLLTRPIGYQLRSEMPVDFFDPLFPSMLIEYTVDRRLTYRLSLILEKAGFPVEHNYPYHLPDGSIEIRAQVWNFFVYLRRKFEFSSPDTRLNPSFQKVWKMLLDTNLRSTESENLRSYLHMFRKAPPGEEKNYLDASSAYREIRDFLQREDMALVREYRSSPYRLSSLAIEVRKDFLWDFADKACLYPLVPKEENAKRVAYLIAEAIQVYLDQDRESV